MKSDLPAHRRHIAQECKALGIRATAKLAGVNPMRVSRFVSGQGADDAAILYVLADAVGLRFVLQRKP